MPCGRDKYQIFCWNNSSPSCRRLSLHSQVLHQRRMQCLLLIRRCKIRDDRFSFSIDFLEMAAVDEAAVSKLVLQRSLSTTIEFWLGEPEHFFRAEARFTERDLCHSSLPRQPSTESHLWIPGRRTCFHSCYMTFCRGWDLMRSPSHYHLSVPANNDGLGGLDQVP
jgi:hypothetical protein